MESVCRPWRLSWARLEFGLVVMTQRITEGPTSPLTILLVDNDWFVLQSTLRWLEAMGHGVTPATQAVEATALLRRRRFDVVICDLSLPDGSGFVVLGQAKRLPDPPPVILVTGSLTAEIGVAALREGAADLVKKPWRDSDLQESLQRTLAQHHQRCQNRQLRKQLDAADWPNPWPASGAPSQNPGLALLAQSGLLGRSAAMCRVAEILRRVAETETTVLITGESGTGKSLLARALHRASRRREGPFVEVACGAVPETLLESELFGHKAGAFTGAVADRPGRFAQADGGTLFLDEIGTATPAFQVKLLRVLQEFQFEPVGATETVSVDTRVVMATNEDLEQLVQCGRFRQDLYYRINVVNLQIPPLRERREDIPLLARKFLARIGGEKAVQSISPESLSTLTGYHWPGNIRQLENVIERAWLLRSGPIIEPIDLPPEITEKGLPSGGSSALERESGLRDALAAPERRIILETLQRNNGNRTRAAEELGINRTTLYKKMRRLGLLSPPNSTSPATSHPATSHPITSHQATSHPPGGRPATTRPAASR